MEVFEPSGFSQGRIVSGSSNFGCNHPPSSSRSLCWDFSPFLLVSGLHSEEQVSKFRHVTAPSLGSDRVLKPIQTILDSGLEGLPLRLRDISE